MEYSDIQQGLNGFVERYDSQTFIGSYRDTTRDSLLKDGLTTRANSLWKMAEYVVAKYDSKPNEPIANYLRGWKELASRIGDQYLLIELSNNTWEMYNSNGIRLGGEDFIIEYFNKKKLERSHHRNSSETHNSNASFSRQVIYYGAPGTGKSHKIKEKLEGENVPKANIFRTTFHPDSDYSTFVGAYKPTRGKKFLYGLNQKETILYKGEDNQPIQEDVITYNFVPQAFLQAYIRAYEVPNEKVYLVIEEINRGNCAQIFGDLFQLLDRDGNGKSDYTIKADSDLRTFLEDEFKKLGVGDDGIKDGELCLPPNLYVYATMNTSDQSLFPIDSAFKRRWDWEYEPIKYKNKDWKIVIGDSKFSWVSFQKAVNNKIKEATSSEDKMLGDYFVNPSDGIVTDKILLNKVLFYLWNDVCKDGEGEIFKTNETTDVTFSELYGEEGKQKLIQMMEYLKVEKISNETETTTD